MATRKKSSAKRQTKKERMAQIERQQAFKKEIFLWIVVAVSILLFISNFGIGGHLGNAVSGFLFGVFGMVAYIFPLVLLVGSFFAVSNKGNSYAIMKLVMTIVFIWFICVFMYLAVYGEFAVSPVQSYIDSVERHSGGGFIGALIGCILVPAVGIIGAYVVTIVVMIICLVLITGKSFMKGMRNGGRKVYESARENNERYQEYRQYKSRERQTREGLASDDTDSDIKEAAKGGRRSKRAGRRMDNKITGVSLDTKIDGSENVLDSGMAGSDTAHVGIFGQGAAATDALGEITIENYPSSPAIKEKKTTSLTSGDAGEIVQTPDFGVASEPVSVLLRNRIYVLCRLYRVSFMVLVCSNLGFMISLLGTTCSWQEHWLKLLDLLALLMLHCRQICLKIKTWCLITGYMLQMEKFIRKVLILIKNH